MQQRGEIRGTQLLERREQVRRALAILGQRNTGDLVPGNRTDLSTPSPAGPYRHLVEHPVTAADRFDRRVHHGDQRIGHDQCHLPVQELAEHEELARTLREPAPAQPGRREHDRARLHPGHPADRHKDRTALHLNGEPEGARRFAAEP